MTTFEWMDRARCLSIGTDEWFGPLDEPTKERTARNRRNRKVCADCPAFDNCAIYAVAYNIYSGIYAGQNTEADRGRRTLREHVAKIGASVTYVDFGHHGCGTVAGWRRHVRRGEQPCDGCTAAYDQREQRRANNKGRAPRPKCGTRGGYDAHRYYGTTICDECRAAFNKHMNEYRAARRRRARTEATA